MAWAAGFFDGEGHVSLIGPSPRTGKSYLRIDACQVRKEPLERLAVVLGGSVNGPYGPYQKNRNPYYRWQLMGEAAEIAVSSLIGYLSPPKREQLEALRG